jgi:hypothetical protein
MVSVIHKRLYVLYAVTKLLNLCKQTLPDAEIQNSCRIPIVLHETLIYICYLTGIMPCVDIMAYVHRLSSVPPTKIYYLPTFHKSIP